MMAKAFVPFCLFLLLCNLVMAQQTLSLSSEDILLVKKHGAEQTRATHYHVRYGFHDSVRRYNPVYHVFSASMYVYQRCISPVISRSCAYAPSCSGYSKALIAEHGLPLGIVCTADRIMRCNRIALADKNVYSLASPLDRHIHEDVHRYDLR